MKFTTTRQYDAPLDEAYKVLDMCVFFEKVANRIEEILDQPYPTVDAVIQIMKEEYDLVLVSTDAHHDALEVIGQ